MMHKIIHEIVDLTLPEYITFSRGITRGHEYKLTIPYTIRIDPASSLLLSNFGTT